MEPKQMLEAEIEKAIENGYQEGSEPFTGVTPEFLDAVTSEVGLLAQHWLLFNHKFAQAFFADDIDTKSLYCKCPTCALRLSSWAYHLQQAVLSEDPLLYYYQHL